MQFIDLTDNPTLFFDILTSDWRNGIEPFWKEYATTSTIYCLVENKQIIAGAILFSTVSPDTKGYHKIAQHWLDKDYLYLAFVFVAENRRSEGLGSLLITKIKEKLPIQKFWLAIEDHGLLNFYNLLGFQFAQKVQNEDVEEWILVSE
ncbi:MAG: hypothetical protein CO118_02090 [Flavobacteriales bacterium CG_4_9_14_3_um_filter_32_8]|nr:MAG: hypothetical protein CO118_02090 [Flavobacteriales bacterium CG_4_9_14_3_um_filter_32_8]